MGRKKITNYEKLILPNWEKIRQIVAHSGSTEAVIAKKIGISFSSWNQYKKEHPEFDEMVAGANIDLITEVWDEVYLAAKRHTNKDIVKQIRNVTQPDGTVKKVMDVNEKQTVVEPNVEAAKMILRNRDPEYHDKDLTEVKLRQAMHELDRLKAENAARDPAEELEELMAEAAGLTIESQ